MYEHEHTLTFGSAVTLKQIIRVDDVRDGFQSRIRRDRVIMFEEDANDSQSVHILHSLRKIRVVARIIHDDMTLQT